MSARLEDLLPEFRTKVEAALASLTAEGLVFRPYFTLRDPVTQARLWRQSRSGAVVRQTIGQLRDQRCDFIVACFERAGPSDGPWATNALPGQSWHQYGEAVDCFLEDGRRRRHVVGRAFRRQRPLAEPPHRAAGRVRLVEGDQ